MEKDIKDDDVKLFVLVDNLIKQVQLIFKLAAKEARLAVYCLQAIVMMTLLLFVVGLCIWLSLLGLLGYELYLYTQSILYALLGILLVNAILYLAIGLLIKMLRQNISFKATRQQIIAIGEKDVH